MKVAALGRTQWLYDSIRACRAAGHDITLIGTCQAASEYIVKEDDFAKLAIEINCPFFCDSRISRPEYVSLLRESKADVAISVNWLTLLGQEILDQFKHGVINAHAGDLPRFRGNAAPNWAILMGEPKVVLTLHRMTVGLDAGPIFLQREFPLTPRTYIGDVYKFIAANVSGMFVEVLEGLATHRVIPWEQPTDAALSLRCFPRLPADGEIDWRRPAEELARLVRASAEPFGGAYSFLDTQKLIIWRARSEELSYPYVGTPGQVAKIGRKSGEAWVVAGRGILILEEAETASAGRCRAAEVIKSSRVRLGMDVANKIALLEERVAQLEAELRRLRPQ